MKSVIAASALALMASTSAFATDVDADIDQIALGIQGALNNILDVSEATNVTQEAVNAANLVSKVNAGQLDTVDQTSIMLQGAKNFIGSEFVYPADLDNVTQSATNVANSVSIGEATKTGANGNADVLDAIRQLAMGAQFASNKIAFADVATDVEQTAVNAANLVSLEVDAGVVDSIEQGSVVMQGASNEIYSGFRKEYTRRGPITVPNNVDLKGVTQSATNVANSISLSDLNNRTPDKVLESIKQGAFVKQSATNMIATAYTAEDVAQEAVNAANLVSMEDTGPALDDVYQSAIGGQVASNTIYFKEWIDGNAKVKPGSDKIVPAMQSATNVVNSVAATKVTQTLAQFSAVSQKASNVADSVGSNSNIWDFEQTAVNAANLVSIDDIDVGLGITQVAFVSQSASNLIDANGTVDAVVQSATNVANSVGDLD